MVERGVEECWWLSVVEGEDIECKKILLAIVSEHVTVIDFRYDFSADGNCYMMGERWWEIWVWVNGWGWVLKGCSGGWWWCFLWRQKKSRWIFFSWKIRHFPPPFQHLPRIFPIGPTPINIIKTQQGRDCVSLEGVYVLVMGLFVISTRHVFENDHQFVLFLHPMIASMISLC